MKSTSSLIEKYHEFAEPWFQKGVPWFTGDSIAWLDANVSGNDAVLEYGSGRSTFWWAQKCKRVSTIETSPDWACYLMLWMYNFPALLKKIRVLFCPAEWNPGWQRGRKAYWSENQDSITYSDVINMEHDFLELSAYGDETILSIDGGVRGLLLVFLGEKRLYERYQIIVIDNTEAAFHSIAPDFYIDASTYTRLDFIAGTMDTVPKVNQGKHVTTVYVRNDRLKTCSEVKTENKIHYKAKELSEYQLFEYGTKEKVRVKYLTEKYKKMLPNDQTQ